MNRLTKLKMVLLNSEYRRVWLCHGVAAAVDHSAALSDLQLSTVVDVGANRGQFALFALTRYPAARVYSFEPLARPATRFKTVFAGETRVILHRKAIGPQAGKTEMHVSGRDDSSSLLPISATQEEIFPGTAEVGIEHVEVVRLNDILRRSEIVAPAMLKVDVQGYELEALRGSEELLSCFEFVCLEVSFVELYEGQSMSDTLIAWLYERDYRLVLMYNLQLAKSGAVVQADVLFKRVES